VDIRTIGLGSDIRDVVPRRVRKLIVTLGQSVWGKSAIRVCKKLPNSPPTYFTGIKKYGFDKEDHVPKVFNPVQVMFECIDGMHRISALLWLAENNDKYRDQYMYHVDVFDHMEKLDQCYLADFWNFQNDIYFPTTICDKLYEIKSVCFGRRRNCSNYSSKICKRT
jgi:hypothetical protein